MSSPFYINALVLGTLPGHLFTRFCNDVVRAEANRIRLPQRFVHDTIHETAPDGGVDLLIGEPDAVYRPTSWNEWIPEGALLDLWSDQPPDDRVLTGYLLGVADRRGEQWLEEKLDDWAKDPARVLLQAAVSGANLQENREIYLEVLGPALEQHPASLWNLDDIFNPYLLSLFDMDTVLAWLEEDIDEHLPAVARSVPIHGQPLAEPARSILVRHGSRDEVRHHLGSTFLTGGWTGSESAYIECKLGQLRGWGEDADPNVRAWAYELTEYFEDRLQRTRLLEEERPY